MAPIRGTLERVLAGHEPNPAVAVDGHWGMVAGNRAVSLLTAGATTEPRSRP
jgi:hypothetical protein